MAKLGVSQSALTQAVRRLDPSRMEAAGWTRWSIAPMEAGERLLGNIGPPLDGTAEELTAPGALQQAARHHPYGGHRDQASTSSRSSFAAFS
jgi:DNA-binding transcriptional LysR family regulator